MRPNRVTKGTSHYDSLAWHYRGISEIPPGWGADSDRVTTGGEYPLIPAKRLAGKFVLAWGCI